MFEKTDVFISGSSRGLGKALAAAFLSQGARVVGFSRSGGIDHDRYEHQNLDLSELANIDQLNLSIRNEAKRAILINNAAALGEVKPFPNLSAESIRSTIDLNFTAPLLISRKFLQEECNENCSKYVINVGSGASQHPIDGWSLYCSTKAGLAMLSRVISEERKIHNYDFKMIDLAPGIVDTAMQDQIRESDPSDFSNLQRFIDYKEEGELQSAEQTADLIIRNFEKLFEDDQPIKSIRTYN